MARLGLEKFGTAGAVLAAAACPVCFPKVALVGAALGLGWLAPFEPYVALGIQALFVLAWLGQLAAYRRHRNRALLGFASATTALVFLGYYAVPSPLLLQLSLAGLIAASVWLIVEARRCAKCASAADDTGRAAAGAGHRT
jgi:mercuric ion transport protein